MSNMDIWNSVFTTDPGVTKPPTKQTKGLSSISGQYYLMRATEVFGPCGIGWGWDVDEERYDVLGDIRNDNHEVIGQAKVHTIKITLWYKLGDQEGKITNYGHTDAAYRSKWGITYDSEAAKKSLTDAIKKCLTAIGIGGDIHMGYHENREYVEEVVNAAALEKADNKIEEQARQDAEYSEWSASHLATMTKAASMNELKTLYTLGVRKAKARGDKDGLLSLESTKNSRKEELEGAKNP